MGGRGFFINFLDSSIRQFKISVFYLLSTFTITIQAFVNDNVAGTHIKHLFDVSASRFSLLFTFDSCSLALIRSTS